MRTTPKAPTAERTPRVPVAASSERGSVSRSPLARRELICVHDRPHYFKSKSKDAETAQEPSEHSESVDSYSLSPGERARVRASVKTNFTSISPETAAIEISTVSRSPSACRELICVHDRPHPGPLPQERENHSAVAGEFGHTQFAMRPEAKSEDAETARESSEFPERADSHSLSPGERARVRASVKTNFSSSSTTSRPLTFLFSHNPCPCVSRQRMRRAFLQSVENYIANELLLAPQLPIPEPKFLNSHRSKKLGSLGIMRLLARMPVMSTIQFDGQAGFLTEEIEVVNPAGMTAAELVSTKAPVAQPTPHELFGPRWLFSQYAGAFSVGHEVRLGRCGRFEKNGFTTALTPALSPGEREKRSPVSCVTKSSDCSSVPRSAFSECTVRSISSDSHFDSRITRDVRLLLPLLGGEGRGEGERHNKLHSELSPN